MRIRQFRGSFEAVSPVIAVVLLVAITVVLVTVLYFSISGLIERTETTPVVALDFEESSTVTGKYTGGIVSISSKVELKDVSLTILDAETGESVAITPLTGNSTASAGAPGATFNLRFIDGGLAGQLDSGDTFFLDGATKGDTVTLAYIPSGDLLDSYVVRY